MMVGGSQPRPNLLQFNKYLPLSDQQIISLTVLKLTAYTSDRCQNLKSRICHIRCLLLFWMAVVDGSYSNKCSEESIANLTW